MEAANILVIDDDEIVARTIERALRSDELHVTVANSGVEGLKVARRRRPDLAILDIIMPGMDGYAVCREMRGDPILAEVPVLFLTARAKDEDRIEGFLAGADDYLAKPFNIDELGLRVRAILRRARRQVAPAALEQPSTKHQPAEATGSEGGRRFRLVIGDYVLDTRTYELETPAHGKVRLTPVQYDLLHHMMCHPDEVFSPARLLDEVWDYPSDTGSPDLVRVHIKNLRERIEADARSPEFLRTVPGFGYTVGPKSE
ncbi:MAG: response regulator transcription factor [Anaerolineales bacterium]